MKATTKRSKALKNHIILCLDSSGSMDIIRDPAIKAFNDILSSIVNNAKRSKQETTISFFTFGKNSAVKCEFSNLPSNSVPVLPDHEYVPDGQTPLFDCVGIAIDSAITARRNSNTAFVLNVITDGEENYSHRYTEGEIQQLIKKVQATDRWTVTFSVPHGNKQHVINLFNLHNGNVMEWEQSERGTRAVAQSFSRSYDQYFASRAAGAKSTRGFFETDLSKVRATTVKKKLKNLARAFVALKVPYEIEIRPFVEKAGYTYVKGNAFYQLSKEEDAIQAYKQILLREKNKMSIFGGDEARDLIGLPADKTVSVRPGNHANWDIFVQSTSVNRKLVRGTTLLYKRP